MNRRLCGTKRTTFRVSGEGQQFPRYWFASEAGTSPDDVSQDASIVSSIAATGAGGTCTLPAGVVVISSAINLTQSFAGKTLSAHASGTTLIRGQYIPRSKVRKLSANDPWFSRFPALARQRIKCIDLLDISVSPGAWPDSSGSHTGESFSESSLYDRPISVHVGSTSLEFAQHSKSVAFGGGAWASCVGAGTSPSTQGVFEISQLPQYHADIRAIVTDDNDYLSYNCSVSSIDGTTGVITLDRTMNASFASNKQRIKLINAPEFLTEAGTMVLSISRNVLYFIPQNDSDEVYISGNDGYVITASDPINMEDTTTYNGSLARKMTISGIAFAATGGSHVHVSTANWLEIKDCAFYGSAAHSVRVSDSEGVKLTNCSWSRCRKNPLIVTEQRATRAASPALTVYDTGPFGLKDTGQVAVPGVFMRRVITAPTISGCTVSDMSLLYPECSPMVLGKYYAILGGTKSLPVTGTALTSMSGCLFKNLSGGAVQNNALSYTITGNQFQNCMMDLTDGGAVASGRSSICGDVTISNNGFKGCYKRFITSQSDDVAGVFLDDGVWGVTVSRNYFDACTVGVISNGGRGHYIKRNAFNDCGDCIRAMNASVATANMIAGQILTLCAAMHNSSVSSNAAALTASWTPSFGNAQLATDWAAVRSAYVATSRAWTQTSSTQPQKNTVCDGAGVTATGNASADINAYMQNWVRYHVTAGDKTGSTGSTVRWQSATAPQQNGYTAYDSGDSASAESVPAWE